MVTPEEFVENFLAHDYDPVKRRDYYLRTRDLKGRESRAVAPSPLVRSRSINSLPTNSAGPQKTSPDRKTTEALIEELKVRLQKLRAVLDQLVNDARVRSGDSPVEKISGANAPSSSAPKQTAQEKADAAQRAKDYYEAHKDEILGQQVKDLSNKISTISEKIKEMLAKSETPTKIASRKPGIDRVGLKPQARKGDSQNGRR